jgi:RNA polymerase sigma-70 factor (ECF subfamily)
VVEFGTPAPAELTQLLQAWSLGDQTALDRLTPFVYAELHRIASRNLAGERPYHVLQPSALVNEAFVRLMEGTPVEWSNRTHFFAVLAKLMRQILIDLARSLETDKRGHRAPHVPLSGIEDQVAGNPGPLDFLDLDAALNDLAALDVRQAQVVELRYFGGLGNEEIAEVLGVSEPTVGRDWRTARAWLYARLKDPSVRAGL